jgi:hypothetical protein
LSDTETLVTDPVADEAAREAELAELRQSLAAAPIDVPRETQDEALAAIHKGFTGKHSHPHSTYGSQGGDSSHEHFHSHAGSSSHNHHAAAVTASALARLGETERRRLDGANEVTDPEKLSAMVASAFEQAGGQEAWEALRAKKGLTASVAADGTVTPAPWHAYACAEGIRTDDGRELLPGSTHYPDMPISIRLLVADEGGHWGAVTCGRVDSCAPQMAQGLNFTYSEGMFGSDPNGQLAELMVEEQTQRFISIDPRDCEGEWIAIMISTGGGDYDDDCFYDEWFQMSSFTLGAMTIVPMPALQMCCITLKDVPLPDSPIAIENAPPSIPSLMPVTAAGGPLRPSRTWFTDPGFHVGDPRMVLQEDGKSYACPLTITKDGQVFGHVAWWECAHTGFTGKKVKPPKSRSNYAFYLTGEGVVCDDGEIVEGVGQLTAGCGHAPTSMGAAEAVAHYDGGYGAFQWADVRAGQDDFGPWVAGALRSDLTAEQIRQVRALSLSGDWRDRGGFLELVAVLAVPVPGFPILRALAASGSAEILDFCAVREGIRGERVVSLVAAGRVVAVPIESRLERLERAFTAEHDELLALRSQVKTLTVARERDALAL